MFTSSPAHVRDALDDAAIARAERRRVLLESLSDLGLGLAEEIGALRGAALAFPEPGRDPARMFAAVARSVRLTVAFEARIDEDILALRKGEVRPWQAARGSLRLDVLFGPSSLSKPTEDELDDDASEAIDQEDDAADEERGESKERLIDYESLGGVDALTWPACVAVLEADLGEGVQDNPASPAKAGAQSSVLMQPGQVSPGSNLSQDRPDRLDPRLRGGSGFESCASPDSAWIERMSPKPDQPPARLTGAPMRVRIDRSD